ncbi:murein hydrolase activator EnvC family protein [Oceanospirillum sp.]|uniref:murein hydrolase activator EnvC family protein n=1 Tax=Oceanospirillum sp. TaxID=2021254 RepID=UPI003A8C99DC
MLQNKQSRDFGHWPFSLQLLSYLLAILLISSSALLSLPSQAAGKEDVSAQQLKELNGRIKVLEQSLNQVKGAKAEVLKKLQTSEKKISDTARAIRSNLASSKRLQSRLSVLRAEKSSLRLKQNQQKDYLEKQIRSAYAMGRQEYLKVLLNQQQPDQISRVLRYYDYINKERSRHIDEYLETAHSLNRVEKEILQKDYVLTTTRSKLEADRGRLKVEQKKRETLVSQLDREISGKGQELARLNQDRARLEKLLKEVQQAIVNIPMPKDTRPFKSMRGKLPWPLKGPVAYAFGSEQIRGKLRRNGMVIRGQEGTEIKAIHSGRVVFSDWLRGYGVLLILDHGNGFMSLYGHNQSLLREAGDWIHAGESIATAGRSGGQSRSGLYFEIRKKGAPQDPIIWLGKR